MISWGCTESFEEEAGDGEEVILDTMEEKATMTMNIMTLHASDIGYIVYPSGINTSTLIIGDSISNTDVRGYFAFDLSPLKGKTLTEVKTVLKSLKLYGDPSFKGYISLCCHVWLPLGPEDYDDPVPVFLPWKSYLNDASIIEYSFPNFVIEDYIQDMTEGDRKLPFRIKYNENISDWDGRIDGREYGKEDISLIVKYED